MRHVDAMMFSRWIVACTLMVLPLAVGCGAKTETVQETVAVPPPSGVGQPQQATPNAVEAPPELGSAIVPESPGPQAPAVAPFSDAAVFDELDELNEADRPRSLFRSIGRALQKGVTDAAGLTPDSSNDAAEPAEE